MSNELFTVIFWTGVIFTGGFWWGVMYAEQKRKKGNKERLVISMPVHADEGAKLLKVMSIMLQELKDRKAGQ